MPDYVCDVYGCGRILPKPYLVALHKRTYHTPAGERVFAFTCTLAGCGFRGTENRSVNDCYVPASDSSSSRVSPAAVGGAVGGSLSVLALGAAAAYFWRLRSASSKERAPLL